jgi:type I restriction enzyme S subunit
VRLGEVATTTSGGTPNRKNPRYYDGEIPWVKIGDLKGRVITETEASITEDGLGNSSAKLLPPGTLLLAMYGSIGKLGVLGISAATNQAICAIRPGRGVNPDFLYWALFAAQGRLVKMGRGGTQQNIGQADINNLRLPLPLPDEQERIVASVEAVNAQVEAARGALKTSLAGVEGLRAALLRDAVVGQLGLAPNAVMKSERKYAAVPFSAE